MDSFVDQNVNFSVNAHEVHRIVVSGRHVLVNLIAEEVGIYTYT